MAGTTKSGDAAGVGTNDVPSHDAAPGTVASPLAKSLAVTEAEGQPSAPATPQIAAPAAPVPP